MRMKKSALALALAATVAFASPVLAQALAPITGQSGSVIVPPATGPVSSPNALPSTPPSATSHSVAKKPARQSLEARFAAANTTHDGHLTADEASAANWPMVSSNFAAIDKSGKGYVTVADIRTFSKVRRAARKHATPAAAMPMANPSGTVAPQ